MRRYIRDHSPEYSRFSLDEERARRNPIAQFRLWFNTARKTGLLKVNAMTLATVDRSGEPAARKVLLKSFDARGFSFFTNYRSPKARELASCPRAALLFHWGEHERQVRINGRVQKTSSAESDRYFRTRPRVHQINAWASHQSAVLKNREELQKQMRACEKRFRGRAIPRPPHWGGYRVIPEKMEFWQGRPDRLHDRLCYTRKKNSGWRMTRLAP